MKLALQGHLRVAVTSQLITIISPLPFSADASALYFRACGFRRHHPITNSLRIHHPPEPATLSHVSEYWPAYVSLTPADLFTKGLWFEFPLPPESLPLG